MMITYAIREANSPREVYLLLASYLEVVRLGGELRAPFLEIAAAPLLGMDNLKGRTLQLFFLLQAASESLDDKCRVAAKEALYVFGAVLDRLNSLEEGTDRTAQRLNRLEHRPEFADVIPKAQGAVRESRDFAKDPVEMHGHR